MMQILIWVRVNWFWSIIIIIIIIIITIIIIIIGFNLDKGYDYYI